MKEHWIEVELKNFIKKTGSTDPRKFPDEEFELFSIPAYDNGDYEKISGRKIGSSKKRIENGDILLSRIVPHIQRCWVVNSNSQKRKIGSTEWIVFESHGINRFYFKWFLLSNGFHKKFMTTISGVGGSLTRANPNQTGKFKIPLPPLPEQRAIVAKIETLFSELDNGIENLKQAQQKLKIYRQSVLKKAFEGELTKEWRAKQKGLPTAEKLLDQIKEEREIYYQELLAEWQQKVTEWEVNGKVGKKPSRPSKPKIICEVEDSDIEDYNSIPKSWYWSRFGNVTYKIGDIDHKMPKIQLGGLPYLSTGNIKANGTLDFKNAKSISREDFDRLALKIKPMKGDIIFPRYGTIGRNILIDFNKEFLVSYSCAIIKNIHRFINSKYSFYYSISPIIQKEIKRYTVETTQANIGIASIELFVFPLCDITEQTQIIQEIENRLSVVDSLERSITEQLQKAEALRQSILKKAFNGELLTDIEEKRCMQESDWEPAEKLLERIKSKI